MFLILCYYSVVISLSIITQTSQLNFTIEPQNSNSVPENITGTGISAKDDQLLISDELNSTSTELWNSSQYDSFTSTTVAEMLPTNISNKFDENKGQILSKTFLNKSNVDNENDRKKIISKSMKTSSQISQTTPYSAGEEYQSINSHIKTSSSTEKITTSNFVNNMTSESVNREKAISFNSIKTTAPPITPSIIPSITQSPQLNQKSQISENIISLDTTNQPQTSISASTETLQEKMVLSIQIVVSDNFNISNNNSNNKKILTSKSTTKPKNSIRLSTKQISFNKNNRQSEISNKKKENYINNNENIPHTKNPNLISTIRNIISNIKNENKNIINSNTPQTKNPISSSTLKKIVTDNSNNNKNNNENSNNNNNNNNNNKNNNNNNNKTNNENNNNNNKNNNNNNNKSNYNSNMLHMKIPISSYMFKNIISKSTPGRIETKQLKSKERTNTDQKSEKIHDMINKNIHTKELLPITIFQTTQKFQKSTIKAPWKTRVNNININSFDKVCDLNKDEGIGSDGISMWYFNKNNGKCEWFTYNGNEGNGNRFYYRANCENSCIEKHENMCTKEYIVNCMESWLRCTMAPDLDCHKNAERKHLNKEIYCSPMQPICSYGKLIRKSPIYLTHRSLIPSDCKHSKDPGTCKTDSNSRLVYYYKEDINDCLGFLYSNCGGNLNRFSTKSDCMNRCAI